LNILNPIFHSQDQEGVERYRVEPYVIAGDVYSSPPHAGRGGWTWYTGSASWFYQIILESILGFQRRGGRLIFDPCIPADWPHLTLTYHFGSSVYTIEMENPRGAESGIASLWLDNQLQAGSSIPLADDKLAHRVRIVVGQA
jgi:cyclic beta-1,2-glucan synthetase